MKKYFILILFVLVVSTVYSQSNKPRVGVLDFTANNISKSEAQTVGEIFTSELVISRSFDVVDRKNIEALMAEMEFQMSGCTDSSCAVEVGQILSLQYMMYGSINKLGETFVINVYMINVETAQIESTAKERFNSIEQSFDVMPVLIGKLIAGDSYDGPEADLEGIKTSETPSKLKVSTDKFIEIGFGYISGDNESGIELETTYRHMLGSKFGLGGGILLGYGFGDDSYLDPGIRIGLNLETFIQINTKLGFGIGFRGLPEYINWFGGPVLSVYLNKLYGRIAFQVIGIGFEESPGVSIDFGYCIKL